VPLDDRFACPLLPFRYDFVYGMPGFGDITPDLAFETSP
jgi:hypothetical protein